MNDSPKHLLVFGPPGAGTTTLGKALAERLEWNFLDVDDVYWFTEDPLPYKRKRNPEHRRNILTEWMHRHDRWVISGALCGWGDVFIPRFDRVIYGDLETPLRLERIAVRETARYGPERLAPGGDLHAVYLKFTAWAAGYETAAGTVRTRAYEEKWLEALPCPVIRLDMRTPTEDLVRILLPHCGA